MSLFYPQARGERFAPGIPPVVMDWDPSPGSQLVSADCSPGVFSLYLAVCGRGLGGRGDLFDQCISRTDLNTLSFPTTPRKARHHKGMQAAAQDCLFCKISKPGGWQSVSQSGDCSTCLAARGDRSQRTAGPALSATPGWGPWPDQLPCQLPSWLVPPLETKARQTPMEMSRCLEMSPRAPSNPSCIEGSRIIQQ